MAAIWTLKMLGRGNDELGNSFLKTMGGWRPDGGAMSNEEAVSPGWGLIYILRLSGDRADWLCWRKGEPD